MEKVNDQALIFKSNFITSSYDGGRVDDSIFSKFQEPQFKKHASLNRLIYEISFLDYQHPGSYGHQNRLDDAYSRQRVPPHQPHPQDYHPQAQPRPPPPQQRPKTAWEECNDLFQSRIDDDVGKKFKVFFLFIISTDTWQF